MAILRRRAAMARAVLPRASDRAMWLLTGLTDHMPSSELRAPRLDEDGPAGAEQEEIGEEMMESDMEE